jgi:3-phenylpropionate/trans-cinnamate dioxygenase ferredoxin reductase component
MRLRRVLVVGASLAGITAANELRAQGYEEELVVVGDEAHAPYVRPPLSKAVLVGEYPIDAVHMSPLADDIKLIVGQAAVNLDLAASVLILENGRQVAFDGLVIATGARARRLASAEQRGEITLRSLDDAIELREHLRSGPDVLVLGGGLLGMEIASSCRDLGLQVTVVDREPPLRRVLGTMLSELIVTAARSAGVRIEISRGDVELIGTPTINGVRLSDGRELHGDLVITAAGDVPNVEWLAGSGLAVGRALEVDDRCRAASRAVGAGDAVAVRSKSSHLLRRPHWANAVDQARLAASTLLHGDAAPIPKVTPYFWTEQFGYELKVAGELPASDRFRVVSGSLEGGCAVVQWLSDSGEPQAAGTLNHRMPIGKLKRLSEESALAPSPLGVGQR